MGRTSHGSTLSGLVHGWILTRARRADAWHHVQETLRGDIADIQGGTTGEGIHLGAMAGTLDGRPRRRTPHGPGGDGAAGAHGAARATAVRSLPGVETGAEAV